MLRLGAAPLPVWGGGQALPCWLGEPQPRGVQGAVKEGDRGGRDVSAQLCEKQPWGKDEAGVGAP